MAKSRFSAAFGDDFGVPPAQAEQRRPGFGEQPKAPAQPAPAANGYAPATSPFAPPSQHVPPIAQPPVTGGGAGAVETAGAPMQAAIDAYKKKRATWTNADTWNSEAEAQSALMAAGLPGGSSAWAMGATSPAALQLLKAMGVTTNATQKVWNNPTGEIDWKQTPQGGGASNIVNGQITSATGSHADPANPNPMVAETVQNQGGDAGSIGPQIAAILRKAESGAPVQNAGQAAAPDQQIARELLSKVPQTKSPVASIAAPPSSAASQLDTALAQIDLKPKTPDLTIGGPTSTAGDGPDFSESQNLLRNSLSGLQGPDRTRLALDALAQADAQDEPLFKQRLREVMQKAAAGGRIGAGMTTNDLTGVNTEFLNRHNELKGSLLRDAAGQTLADNLNKAGMTRSVAGDLGGLTTQNFTSKLASKQLEEALTQGAFGRSLDTTRFNADQDQNRFGNTMAALQLQDALTGSDFGRKLASAGFTSGENQRGISNEMSWLQMMMPFAFSNASIDPLLKASQNYGGMGDMSAIIDAMKAAGYGQAA